MQKCAQRVSESVNNIHPTTHEATHYLALGLKLEILIVFDATFVCHVPGNGRVTQADSLSWNRLVVA